MGVQVVCPTTLQLVMSCLLAGGRQDGIALEYCFQALLQSYHDNCIRLLFQRFRDSGRCSKPRSMFVMERTMYSWLPQKITARLCVS